MGNPWSPKHGIASLTNLADLPPPPAPAPEGLELRDGASVDEFIESLRAYAIEIVDPELLDDRQSLWTSEPKSFEDLEPWMTLRASDNLQEYREVLEDDAGVDDRSASAWVNLLSKGPYGYAEGCRILFHLLKDKEYDPRGASRDPSAYLATCSREAIKALENSGAWEQGPRQVLAPSKGSWGAAVGSDDPWGFYQGTSSSSYGPPTGPSDAAGGPGPLGSPGPPQQKGKGKGKGKWFLEGFR